VIGEDAAGAAPLVSVLIPCWNAESTIEAAIASALEVRSVALECIVVDDASTDRTAQIVTALAARDPRVVLVPLPENAGVSHARNVGLECVRGTWLTLLDADDRFLPGGLERLIGAASSKAAGAVIGQQVWWDGRRRWLSTLYDIPDIRRPGRKSLAANPGLVYSVSPHAKLFHRSCFDGLRFSGRVLGDQPWVIRALLRAGDQIEVLGETVYEWYRPRDGASAPSITSTTRASACRSAEAAAVALEAFVAVAEEAGRSLEPARRDAILRRYAERLVRSDLGPMLTRGAARADPCTAQLLDAIDAFVGGAPGGFLIGSPVVARDLLEPPLRNWRRLDAPARAAYRRLVETALATDPRCAAVRPWLARLGLAAGLRGEGRGDHVIASALLSTSWLLDGIGRRARRVLPSRSGRA
jgi:glycosyltransferase involved in cell wall biosynthesis